MTVPPAVTGSGSTPSSTPPPDAPGAPAPAPAPAAAGTPSGLPGVFQDGFQPAGPAVTSATANAANAADGAAAGAGIARATAGAPELTPEARKVYDALPQDQRDRYDAISGALTAGNRPDAARALEQLLRDDVVSRRVEENPGGTLLDQLAPLAEGGKTKLGIDRTAVLAQTLLDLADPEKAILQGPNNNECGGTAVSYILATRSPAEYARVNAQLAENGYVWVGNPAVRGQRAGYMSLGTPLPVSVNLPQDRSVTQQLVGRAFVERAAGPSDSPMGAFFQGLTGEKVVEAFNRVFGGASEAMYVPDENEEPKAGRRAEAQREARFVLEDQARAGKLPMANHDGHWCVVTGTDDAGVTVVDGTGKKVTMAWTDFLSKLDTVVYDSLTTQTSEYVKAHPEWGRPGGGGGVQTDGIEDRARA